MNFAKAKEKIKQKAFLLDCMATLPNNQKKGIMICRGEPKVHKSTCKVERH